MSQQQKMFSTYFDYPSYQVNLGVKGVALFPACSLFFVYSLQEYQPIRNYKMFLIEKNSTYFLVMCVWHIFDFLPHS